MNRKLELDIAKTLTQAAASYSDDETHEQASFTFGTFTVRCRARRSSIEAVAAKFKRGSAKLKGPGYKPFSFEQAWRDLKVVGPYDWRDVT